MRLEGHVHADIPILEGVSRRQLEQAFAPLLEYLDADGLADVKSLEPDEPGIKYDEKELILTVCWTGEIGRSFHGVLEAALEGLAAEKTRTRLRELHPAFAQKPALSGRTEIPKA